MRSAWLLVALLCVAVASAAPTGAGAAPDRAAAAPVSAASTPARCRTVRRSGRRLRVCTCPKGRRLSRNRRRCVRRARPAPVVSPTPGATPAPAPAQTPPEPQPSITPTPTATATPVPTVTPSGDGRRVQVRGGEFWLVLSRPDVLAGAVTVEFNLRQAEDPHDLLLLNDADPQETHGFGEQPSGAVETKTFTLEAGSYTLLCTLPDHESRGMRATLVVN